jgi:hypothetical protein
LKEEEPTGTQFSFLMAPARQFNATESEASKRSYLEATMMRPPVAISAERNQIVHHIAPQSTPGFYVMDL